MATKKNQSKTAARNVTVKLHGWPREVRSFSVVNACWMVTLEFRNPKSAGHGAMTHTVFTSDDWGKAKAQYDAFVKIVE